MTGHQDIVRGRIDAPLAPRGEAEADHMGRRIAAKGGVDSIVSSPRGRAKQTTAAIMRHNPQARFDGTDQDAEPWAQGEAEGQLMDKVDGELKYYANHPAETIPGIGASGVPGESVDQVIMRSGRMVKKHLARLRPGEKKLVVAHHTQLKYLRGWAKKGFPPDMSADGSEMQSENHTVEPAKTMLRLAKKDGHPHLHEDDVNSDEPIRPGLTFASHGATPLNKEAGDTGSLMKRLKVS